MGEELLEGDALNRVALQQAGQQAAAGVRQVEVRRDARRPLLNVVQQLHMVIACIFGQGMLRFEVALREEQRQGRVFTVPSVSGNLTLQQTLQNGVGAGGRTSASWGKAAQLLKHAPLNGGRPASSSKRMVPTLQRSAFASYYARQHRIRSQLFDWMREHRHLSISLGYHVHMSCCQSNGKADPVSPYELLICKCSVHLAPPTL